MKGGVMWAAQLERLCVQLTAHAHSIDDIKGQVKRLTPDNARVLALLDDVVVLLRSAESDIADDLVDADLAVPE